jgi:hypothetical protein
MNALVVFLWVLVVLALSPVLLAAVGGVVLAIDEAKALMGLADVFSRK